LTSEPAGQALVLVCRSGYQEPLADEVRAATQRRQPGWPTASGAGWVAVRGLPPGPLPGALRAPLIFERQRLAMARWFPMAEQGLPVAPLAAWLGERLAAGATPPDAPWCLHAYAPETSVPGSQEASARRLGTALLRALGEHGPELGRRRRTPEAVAAAGIGWVAQVCVVAGGVWAAAGPLDSLSDGYPGGVHRMRPDPLAPSRSYLKVEEALELMGTPPLPRERVVDLGAAPGGWSYAFLKRGCRVLAVDNGPLKIGGLDDLPGQLTHLREDGLAFRPGAEWLPVDWLAADMLIAPGQALGLLRRWLAEGWMRRFIVNVKLPQRHPLVALEPIREHLRGVPGCSFRLRHLYHDRREVTLMGTAEPKASASQRPGQRRAQRPKSSPPPGAPAPRRGSGSDSPATRGREGRGAPRDVRRRRGR
jgi:23S rRNA (cytidine2498-2'-O)-methyltransferase